MGRAKVCRRPVTITTSIPKLRACRSAARSASEIWNCGLSRVPSISTAIRRIESAATDDSSTRRAGGRVPDFDRAGEPSPAKAYLMRQSFPTETSDEIEDSAPVPDPATGVPTRAKGRHFRQALCGRVLLQSQVGLCRRVPSALQEEPLPAAEEAGRDGTHAEGLDGPAALPYDRRRALGLSCHHRLQELCRR